MQDSRTSPTRPKRHTQPEGIIAPRGRVDIRQLVGQRRQVTISHGHQDYILRITRNGKLILTK
jgi:hemin uptake protein HemP